MLRKYILILIIFVPCCLYFDSIGVKTYEIIRTPEKPYYLGAGFNYNKGFDYKTISLSFKSINNAFSFNNYVNYGLEFNLLSITTIKNDRYNNNEVSYSYLSLYFASILATNYLAKEVGIYNDSNSFYKALNDVGSFLILFHNPKINYTIINENMGRKFFITSSVFVNYKLDYFSNNKIKWTRVKPSIGLEFDFIKADHPIIIGLEMGYEKAFDIGINGKNNITPNIGFKLFFGITKSVNVYESGSVD